MQLCWHRCVSIPRTKTTASWKSMSLKANRHILNVIAMRCREFYCCFGLSQCSTNKWSAKEWTRKPFGMQHELRHHQVQWIVPGCLAQSLGRTCSVPRDFQPKQREYTSFWSAGQTNITDTATQPRTTNGFRGLWSEIKLKELVAILSHDLQKEMASDSRLRESHVHDCEVKCIIFHIFFLKCLKIHENSLFNALWPWV